MTKESAIDALKAEVERLRAETDRQLVEIGGLVEKAEKAEADLERARPLLEAAGKAEITGRHPETGRPTCLSETSVFRLETAALAYKEAKEKK